jgi:inosine triphosphate pyrophosphatase
MPQCVNFITGNANKLREVKAILEPGIEVRSQNLDLEEVQGTIEEVTISKTRRAAELVDGPVLVEDTSLCYTALGGLPGPYIKWFMSRVGHQGLNNMLAAYEDKSAEAVCTFGYSPGRGQEPILFQGRCPVCYGNPVSPCQVANRLPPRVKSSLLVDLPNPRVGCCLRVRGTNVSKENPFWPMAVADVPLGLSRYAEMDKTEKNKISHRGRALAKLQEWFKDKPQSA